MNSELISGKTRLRFREYFVGTTLGEIRDAFRAAGIECSAGHHPEVFGQRRYLVEQYYHAVDFSDPLDVKKVLVLFEHVLEDLDVKANYDGLDPQRANNDRDILLKCLRQDGFVLAQGKLVPHHDVAHLGGVREAVSALDAPELARQIARLRDSVEQDPGLAVGTAKEMLETTCKTILEQSSVAVDPTWDVPALLKETRKVLKLLPDDVPAAAKGAETIKRLLSSLGQVGIGLSELRNLYGSGHGRSGKTKGLSPRHARLAVGAVSTLTVFLFETYQERQKQPDVV